MPVTRSSTRPTPYPVRVPEFSKVNKQLKKAKTPEDKENILANLKKSPEVYDAFRKQFPLSPIKKQNEVPMEMEVDKEFVPDFVAAYRKKLMKIYEVLTTTVIEKQKEECVDELKEDSKMLKEFLRKTLPSAEFLPVIEEIPQVYGLFLPSTGRIYKDSLDKLYTAIRAAKTPKTRETVLNNVVKNPHLVREFLKRNVPQLSNL